MVHPADPLQPPTAGPHLQAPGDPADRGASADAAGHRNTTQNSLVSQQVGAIAPSNLNTREELIIAFCCKWKLYIKCTQQHLHFISSLHVDVTG